MTNLNVSQERLARARAVALDRFGPMLLQEALSRLCGVQGADALGRFERSMIERIENATDEASDFDLAKEFAVEQLLRALREVKCSPLVKQDVENIGDRRTHGRSENPATLAEQLDRGLEDSFPASDPPAVVSTTISGRTKPLVGTDEVLRRQRERAA